MDCIAKTGIAESPTVQKDCGGNLPRSIEIAQGGLKTTSDLAKYLAATAEDVSKGDVTPGVANAAMNAIGRFLDLMKIQLRYNPGKILNTKAIALFAE